MPDQDDQTYDEQAKLLKKFCGGFRIMEMVLDMNLVSRHIVESKAGSSSQVTKQPWRIAHAYSCMACSSYR